MCGTHTQGCPFFRFTASKDHRRKIGVDFPFDCADVVLYTCVCVYLAKGEGVCEA